MGFLLCSVCSRGMRRLVGGRWAFKWLLECRLWFVRDCLGGHIFLLEGYSEFYLSGLISLQVLSLFFTY